MAVRDLVCAGRLWLALLLLGLAGTAQAAIPLSGWKTASGDFANGELSAGARLPDVGGARASLALSCNAYGASLNAELKVSGTTFDVETSSDVHSTINLLGPSQYYTTEERVVTLQVQWSGGEAQQMALSGSNNHLVSFSIPFDRADNSYHIDGRLLLGFSVDGNAEALSLDFHDATLQRFSRNCALAAQQHDDEEAAAQAAEAAEAAKAEAQRKAQADAEAEHQRQLMQAAEAERQQRITAVRLACRAGQAVKIRHGAGPLQLTGRQGAGLLDQYVFSGQLMLALTDTAPDTSCHVEYLAGHRLISGYAPLGELDVASPAEAAQLANLMAAATPAAEPTAAASTAMPAGHSDWQGQFRYRNGLPPGRFTASLDIGNDGSLTGKSHDDGIFLTNATLKGRIQGSHLRWQKNYSGLHVVEYEGELSTDGQHITGKWRTAGGDGSFEMQRQH